MPFSKLGLTGPLLEGVKAMGYQEPTPIQARAIPLILSGKDVIGSAQTGTGKTAAFALPILSELKEHQPGGPRCLVLEPTRELAAQVETAVRDFSRFTNLRPVILHGGVGYGHQNESLHDGVDIVVATPGRLLDHIQRRNVSLSRIQYLVLDEADRMLDMGFMPDVRRIIDYCPRQRHTSLFTATLPFEIEQLTKWGMKDPETIEIGRKRSAAESVQQCVYPVMGDQKIELLRHILEKIDYDSVIIFCRTKHRADRVAQLLKRHNHPVAILHSNRTQREREQALQGFREGKFEVLVATDIASRGLDIANVSHIVNFDVPQHPEDYIHRIGRTGRADATGDAFTLMAPDERMFVEAIEKFMSAKLIRAQMEGFEYSFPPVLTAPPRNPKLTRRTFRPRRR